MSFWPDGVAIVAEVSCNHGGKVENAFRLIDAAQDAGATHIKLQAYTADEVVALRGDGPAVPPWNHLTKRELYERAATPLEWFPVLAEYCSEVGMPWFASVSGAESLAAMEACGCPVYKIAAMEADNEALIGMVQETGKYAIRSSPDRVRRKTPDGSRVLPVYCGPGYPQPKAGVAALQLRGYWGYSYHGTDPDIPAFAVAAGARYIETHLQLEDEPSKFEAEFAMTPSVFRQMVRRIRKAEAAL